MVVSLDLQDGPGADAGQLSQLGLAEVQCASCRAQEWDGSIHKAVLVGTPPTCHISRNISLFAHLFTIISHIFAVFPQTRDLQEPVACPTCESPSAAASERQGVKRRPRRIMRAWIFSDLHVEQEPNFRFSAIPDADVCICAGDITDRGPKRGIEWLGDHIAPHMPVIFVPGAHDFYGSSVTEGLAEAHRTAHRYGNIFILDGAYVALDGYQFIGATVWTDFKLHWDMKMATTVAQKTLDEYHRIKISKRPNQRFTPQNRLGLHVQDLAKIMWATQETESEHRIIISHHAPTLMSIPHSLLRDPLAASLASRLEHLILEYDPILWVHGHIHKPSNYLIGNTRVICNPRGFRSEPSLESFDPYLVVELAEIAQAAERNRRESDVFRTIRASDHDV
ncbi:MULTISPECIES: metallophosphoesterase [unclassified Aminobacter]|uniref:metallophosphoesterase n=1 Tax=unclassified Aminobacter TaxID=2644704 RepID=UPI0004B19490|nr:MULTISPECIES: metallophosphoesterase [unclassified Aminobacter]TWH36519.1 Icc-related predicted phosphoesterase [Aminobacter sp. J15]